MKKIRIILLLSFVLLILLGCKYYSRANLFKNHGYFKLLPMTVEPRAGHTATLLNDGRVLITGGGAKHGILKSAEVYNPKTNKFTKTGDMTTPRVGHAAVLLKDGRVLITGGEIQGKHTLEDLKAAEFYDPKTEKFAKINDSNHPWFFHKMILLNDGKVLLCSNVTNQPINSKFEIYNPKTNKFKEMPSCLTRICPVNATLLNNRTILLSNGYSMFNKIGYNPQIFDPKTEKFKYTGKMNFYRLFSTSTLLTNGNVVVIGGTSVGFQQWYKGESEIYNPSTGIFHKAARIIPWRYWHSSILLPNGKVLIVGGYTGQDETLRKIKNADLYDPKTDKFIKISNMHYPRLGPTLTLLKNGNVLIMSDGKRPELYISK